MNNSQDLGMEFLVSWQVGGGGAGVALRQRVQLREHADRHQVATDRSECAQLAEDALNQRLEDRGGRFRAEN